MNQPRKRLKRLELPGQARFLTFSCCHRLPLFGNDQIKACFAERLCWITAHMPVQLAGWVLMPDHVHLLILPEVDRLTVPQMLSALKRPVARRVLDRWRELDAPILARLADQAGAVHFWQAGGGYDRNIHTVDEFIEKLHYMHRNPVTRGLVTRAEDWLWSSARWYAGMAYDGPKIAQII